MAVNMKITKINEKQVFRYMGYKNTTPDAGILKKMEVCEKRLLETASQLYVYRVFDLQINNNFEKPNSKSKEDFKIFSIDSIEISGSNLLLTGNSIVKHLKGCSRVILFAATLSSSVDKLLRLLQISDITDAFITDAMASTLIEQVCDEAELEIKSQLELQAQEQYYTWRYSPGYGDLPLSIQQSFLSTIDAQRQIGLCTTSSDVLTPRKSVTAIIGISNKPLGKTQRSYNQDGTNCHQSEINKCNTCNLRNSCAYSQIIKA